MRGVLIRLRIWCSVVILRGKVHLGCERVSWARDKLTLGLLSNLRVGVLRIEVVRDRILAHTLLVLVNMVVLKIYETFSNGKSLFITSRWFGNLILLIILTHWAVNRLKIGQLLRWKSAIILVKLLKRASLLQYSLLLGSWSLHLSQRILLHWVNWLPTKLRNWHLLLR